MSAKGFPKGIFLTKSDLLHLDKMNELGRLLMPIHEELYKLSKKEMNNEILNIIFIEYTLAVSSITCIPIALFRKIRISRHYPYYEKYSLEPILNDALINEILSVDYREAVSEMLALEKELSKYYDDNKQ